MDLLTVDPETYLADKPIENFNSAIWTERFTTAGDFEIRSARIEQCMALLPERKFITHRDTHEIFRVETHNITRNDKGAREILIKGRSLAALIPKRFNRAFAGDATWPMQKEYTAQDALAVMIWNHWAKRPPEHGGFSFVYDYTYGAGGQVWPLGQVPNLLVTQTVTLQKPHVDPGEEEVGDMSDLVTTKEWTVSEGPIESFLTEAMTLGKLGIRIIRPGYSDYPNAGDTRVIVVDQAGNIAKNPLSQNQRKNCILVDIYNGVDRTMNRPAFFPGSGIPDKPLVFRADTGDIVTPNYLNSVQDQIRWVSIRSPDFEDVVFITEDGRIYTGANDDPGAASWDDAPQGWDFLATQIDGGNPDYGVDYFKLQAILRQKGVEELRRSSRQSLMDGTFSDSAGRAYKVTYDLGDFVTVIGEYTDAQDMRISEFINTQDRDGESTYPTLVKKDEEA